ncbi:MAG: hypothetical protein DBX47_06035 [Clostridiales bacterium]|nr:MAG: hypothetical protein DBX47_06035 [Clostridiales bacterium]
MSKECRFGILFVLINTIILGLIASFSHFAYALSGNLIIVGLFNPVNESVWEHLKFMVFPNLLWWIIMYFIKKRKCQIDLHKWIIATAVSVVTAPLTVLFIFYSYTGALGIESLIFDIILVYICYFIALKLAIHVYTYVKPTALKIIFSVITIIVIFLAFIVFTFIPPHYPIFCDTTTGAYGIVL